MKIINIVKNAEQEVVKNGLRKRDGYKQTGAFDGLA